LELPEGRAKERVIVLDNRILLVNIYNYIYFLYSEAEQ